jgi:nitroreductase
MKKVLQMDVFDVIRGRRSVRSYTREEVSEEELIKVLEAGRGAPSAGNVQPWELVIVRDGATKSRLAMDALGQDFISEAPVVVVVCVDLQKAGWAYGERGEKLYCLQDAAAFTQNMLLAAYALGLGTCWVGAFQEEAVRKTLSIPDECRPVAIVPIGHSAEKPLFRSKRSLKEITHNERF